MKNVTWLIFCELKQNRLLFSLIFSISLLLGLSGNLSLRAKEKISRLANADVWNADLVILPKGITLQDFKEEILSGNASSFLPEAMFDSTLSLSNGQFQLEAVLPIVDTLGPILMMKGTNLELGLVGMKEKIRIISWTDQSYYSTPEWKNKLIAGFFAKGSPLVMRNLKDMIDRRTVGQAIDISQQQDHEKQIQSQLKDALVVYSGALLILVVLSFSSLMLWLRIKISNSLNVFMELGMTTGTKRRYFLGLLVLSVFFPFAIGVGLADTLVPF